MKLNQNLFFAIFILAFTPMTAQVDMQKIDSGTYLPLYGVAKQTVQVEAFYMDTYPVTNREYLKFVNKYPEWNRSEITRLFADKSYLADWKDDSTLNVNAKPQAAVTSVSWYAASEYCKCQGKRLPTLDEWEYAAMASETSWDGQQDSLFNQKIIESYETPKTNLRVVGTGFKNYWGLYDMHGLVWEWTSDFNSVLISGESRKDGSTDRKLFCAAGSVGASDLMDYAAFMRYAFRGSVKANYCIRTLGFRCAKNAE